MPDLTALAAHRQISQGQFEIVHVQPNEFSGPQTELPTQKQ
ncbi:hypothetical protein N0D28_09910 [Deinococcus rubellus]|uniref:Uncharacterized protein n=1 Tax=Deinococcus rubellus TaxID=1889240 RepID=A0ABY5YDC3_9DEIO|nr:hypothetical protein [Deinococcus rubellus]UWX63074.1 hypothetical protein N0D28_09910 [Deinococcus rubellus]